MLQIAGVDEAGRGPLAGPVVAAAVILNPDKPIAGLMDSKKLTEKKRDALFLIIQENALAFAIASASAEEIDQLNILQASLLAMHRAVQLLPCVPQKILVDGNQLPKWPYASEAVVRGDETVAEISAASILAKVTRDKLCSEFENLYPGYGFAQHKGYGTKLHIAAIQKLGPCAIHRKTFAPIKDFCSVIPAKAGIQI